MPVEDFPGLPKGYQVLHNFKGGFYVLVENHNPLPLTIAEFPFRPSLKRCLDEIEAWEQLRANVRGEGLDKDILNGV